MILLNYVFTDLYNIYFKKKLENLESKKKYLIYCISLTHNNTAGPNGHRWI